MCLKLRGDAIERERRQGKEARRKALVESHQEGEDEESQEVHPGHSKTRHWKGSYREGYGKRR